MRRGNFTKFNEAVTLLNEGWEIFTERGSAPYSPLYFYLYSGDSRKKVHEATVRKLIKDNVIHGTDRKRGKYSLK